MTFRLKREFHEIPALSTGETPDSRACMTQEREGFPELSPAAMADIKARGAVPWVWSDGNDPFAV